MESLIILLAKILSMFKFKPEVSFIDNDNKIMINAYREGLKYKYRCLKHPIYEDLAFNKIMENREFHTERFYESTPQYEIITNKKENIELKNYWKELWKWLCDEYGQGLSDRELNKVDIQAAKKTGEIPFNPNPYF